MVDADEVAGRLYRVAPEDFVAARDEAVAEARAAGERDTAREIAGFKRPTRAAWLTNLLVADTPDEVDGLLELAGPLAEAQRSLDGAALREVSAQRSRLVGGLARRAVRLGRDAGHRIDSGLEREVRGVLESALADAELADRVRSGRLVRAERHSGFGTFGFGEAGDEAGIGKGGSGGAGGEAGSGKGGSGTGGSGTGGSGTGGSGTGGSGGTAEKKPRRKERAGSGGELDRTRGSGGELDRKRREADRRSSERRAEERREREREAAEERERRRRQQALTDAEDRVERARLAAHDAARERDDARERAEAAATTRDDAHRRVDELRTELDRARSAATDADRALRSAEHTAGDAERRARRADTEVTDAERALDELQDG